MPQRFDPLPSRRSELYESLSRGQRLTQQDAADRLDVTPRQVRNLIQQLREDGVPVQSGFEDRQRIYYLDPQDWHADTVTLDLPERQLLALLVATHAARPTLGPTPLSDALEGATSALEETLGKSVVSFIPAFESERWHFSRAMSVDLDPDVFWTLKRAIADQHPVRIDYYSAYRDAWSRKRRINPLLFAVRKGAWLCVAYCHRRETTIDFNLVDIESVDTVEGAHFDPPAEFDRDAYFAGRFGALAGGDEYDVELHVASELQPYFARKLYHPTQQVRPAEEGDGFDVMFQVQGLDEIASFVRSWGPGVTVRTPDELVQRIVEDTRRVLDQYDTGTVT